MMSQFVGGGVERVNEQGNCRETVQVVDIDVAERRGVDIGKQARLQVELFVDHLCGGWAAKVMLYGVLRLSTATKKASIGV